MEKTISFLKKERVIVLIFSLSLTLRVIFLSPWLEDWDSVQFALALHNYSLVDHQPHPPGYPLYIVLGRIFNFFLNNDTLSLTFLSSALGAASVIPLFLILQCIVRRQIAILLIIVFVVTPLHWSLSEVALTNIPGMSFSILTAWFLYRGWEVQKYLLIGGFLAGLILGVRFAEYSIVGTLLGLLLIYKRSFSDLLKSATLFLFGLSIWLVPLVIHTGLNNFWTAYTVHTQYIINHDSIVQYTSILDRLTRIWELFLMGYSPLFLPILGLGTWHLLKTIYLTCLASTPRGWVRLTRRENWPTLFSGVWLLSYLLPLIFIYNLEVPRHVLPLLPPLVLLAAIPIQKILMNKTVLVICIIMAASLFVHSLEQVKKFRSIVPPTIAPVLYTKENFDPKETTLITTFTYRQFQYYAPEFENYYGAKNTPSGISSPTVIIDYIGTKGNIPELTNYKIIETKEFSGPEDLFPRLSKTTLVILKRSTF